MTLIPSTSTLLNRIYTAKEIGPLFAQNEEAFTLPPFHIYLSRLCAQLDQVPEQVILRSGIHRTYGHQLFNGLRKPSRDKVLQLALGFGLSVDGAQALLQAARAAALYPRVKRDAALLYALNQGFSVLDLQALLNELGLPLLGSAERER